MADATQSPLLHSTHSPARSAARHGPDGTRLVQAVNLTLPSRLTEGELDSSPGRVGAEQGDVGQAQPVVAPHPRREYHQRHRRGRTGSPGPGGAKV